jgi:hypothetical protein
VAPRPGAPRRRPRFVSGRATSSRSLQSGSRALPWLWRSPGTPSCHRPRTRDLRNRAARPSSLVRPCFCEEPGPTVAYAALERLRLGWNEIRPVLARALGPIWIRLNRKRSSPRAKERGHLPLTSVGSSVCAPLHATSASITRRRGGAAVPDRAPALITGALQRFSCAGPAATREIAERDARAHLLNSGSRPRQ